MATGTIKAVALKSDATANANAISKLQSEVGLVINGNTASVNVTSGQYVVVINSTISGITDGLYRSTANVNASTAFTSSNLTAISNGVSNELAKDMTAATSSTAGTHGLVPAPAAGKQGQYLRGDGTWNTPTNTTYSDMTGASSSAAGTHGLVPAPAAGKQASFLRGDGTWVVPTDTTYSDFTGASSSSAGTHGLVPAPAKGKQASFLRGDKTWATPSNTWRGFQVKNYSHSYTCAASSKVDITASNLGFTAVSGYTAVGVLRLLTGSPDTYIDSFQFLNTSDWCIRIVNKTTAQKTGTVYASVLFLQND